MVIRRIIPTAICCLLTNYSKPHVASGAGKIAELGWGALTADDEAPGFLGDLDELVALIRKNHPTLTDEEIEEISQTT